MASSCSAILAAPFGCGDAPWAVAYGHERLLRVIAVSGPTPKATAVEAPVAADLAATPANDTTSGRDADALMAQVAAGGRAAFAPLYALLWPKVRALCGRLLQGHADADDAAQQALETILCRADEYEPGRSAMAWALGIAAWECRTQLRKRWRRREATLLPGQGEAPVLGADAPEGDTLRAELVAAALSALGELSDLDRDTLLATYWDREPKVVGATFRKRRERALHRLRQKLRSLYDL